MAESDEILRTLQPRGFGAREEFFSFEEVEAYRVSSVLTRPMNEAETRRIDLKRAPHRSGSTTR